VADSDRVTWERARVPTTVRFVTATAVLSPLWHERAPSYDDLSSNVAPPTGTEVEWAVLGSNQ
jgi:hypothetical protein